MLPHCLIRSWQSNKMWYGNIRHIIADVSSDSLLEQRKLSSLTSLLSLLLFSTLNWHLSTVRRTVSAVGCNNSGRKKTRKVTWFNELLLWDGAIALLTEITSECTSVLNNSRPTARTKPAKTILLNLCVVCACARSNKSVGTNCVHAHACVYKCVFKT